MQHVYRRIIGLYKVDHDRLHILHKEGLLTPAQLRQTREDLRSRMGGCLPLFLQHSEQRPTVKKAAKAQDIKDALKRYDSEFYRTCETAYPHLNAQNADKYYTTEVRIALSEEVLDMFGKSVGCQKSVKISPAVPLSTYPQLLGERDGPGEAAHRGPIDDQLVNSIVEALLTLKKSI